MRLNDIFPLDYTAIEIKLSRLQRGEPKTPSSGTSNDTIS